MQNMNNRRLIKLLEQYATDSDALNEWDILGFRKRAQEKKDQIEQNKQKSLRDKKLADTLYHIKEESKHVPVILFVHSQTEWHNVNQMVDQAVHQLGNVKLFKLDMNDSFDESVISAFHINNGPSILILKNGIPIDHNGNPVEVNEHGVFSMENYPLLFLAPFRGLSNRNGGRSTDPTAGDPNDADNVNLDRFESIPTTTEQLVQELKHRLHI